MSGNDAGGEISGAVNLIGLFLVKAGAALIDNMAILFAIGVGVGMSEKNDGTGGIAALASWLMITTLLSTGVVTTIIPSIAESATKTLAFDKIENPFIGILAGIIGSACYNRFKDTKLPDWLSFFSGKRCVAIVSGVVSIVVSAVLLLVWPLLFGALVAIGKSIVSLDVVGAGIYAFLNRLLIPTGLHHILNQLIRFTPIGGTAEIDGQQVSGALNIFNTLLMQQNPDMDVMRQATRFLTQGTHPFMVFGLPAACYAMYKTAYPQNREKAKGILLAAGLTSFFTGITEPIEFTFLFVSPLLWVIHATLTAASQAICDIFTVRPWGASGLIEFLIYNLPLPVSLTRWPGYVLIGIGQFAVYYVIFRTLVVKLNLKTPGREDDENVKLYSKAEYRQKVAQPQSVTDDIIRGLGGKENILSVDNCFTRLRVAVRDMARVDDTQLKNTGANGVVRNRNEVQVIYGVKVGQVRSRVDNWLAEN